MPELRRASVLRAAPAAVWAHVTTFAGVNDEFRPLLRMTVPRGATFNHRHRRLRRRFGGRPAGRGDGWTP